MSSESLVSLRAVVMGKVQDVFFRASTLEQAQALGVHGSVQNLADGGVEVRMQGESASVERLLEWVHRGPPAAAVTSVHISDLPIDSELRTFRIEE